LHSASPAALLQPVPVDTPGASVLNANLDRLNTLLFAPPAYAVIAQRS
jgi:hypothetical protein